MNEKKTDKKYEDEIDFKELLKTPKRLFGWVFPYFFFILLLLGIFYVNTLTEISLNNVPVNPPVEDDIKRTLEMKKGKELPPVDLDVIQNPSDELINKGAELYEQNCASCHGSEGLGDGPAGAA
ncbi:MAG: c-type cytochrome [Melioribacteraceae bacterium]|nr:c-type cytochrome [Melioribacteraceae bacterium]